MNLSCSSHCWAVALEFGVVATGEILWLSPTGIAKPFKPFIFLNRCSLLEPHSSMIPLADIFVNEPNNEARPVLLLLALLLLRCTVAGRRNSGLFATIVVISLPCCCCWDFLAFNKKNNKTCVWEMEELI